MKLFSGILAIYFMALSIMPCTDMISPCIGDVNAEVSMADDNHGHSHSDEDGCTPFCSCACCGSMLVIPSINQLDVSKVYLSASYQIHYKFDYCFDFSLVNWHPPTLS